MCLILIGALLDFFCFPHPIFCFEPFSCLISFNFMLINSTRYIRPPFCSFLEYCFEVSLLFVNVFEYDSASFSCSLFKFFLFFYFWHRMAWLRYNPNTYLDLDTKIITMCKRFV